MKTTCTKADTYEFSEILDLHYNRVVWVLEALNRYGCRTKAAKLLKMKIHQLDAFKEVNKIYYSKYFKKFIINLYAK